MSSTLSAPPSALLGSQRPRVCSGPSSQLSEGGRIADLAASAGLDLDDWERWVLDQGLGRVDSGMWAAFEVCLIVARQNGKGAVLEALELAALFLDDFGVDLILHSAHEFKTAAEAFRRIEARIEQNPYLRRRVRQIYRQRGAESVELRNGKRLRFIARTSGSGRGFTADLIILDEAYELGNDQMAALLPTLSSRPNPQIWYTSTAGTQSSTQLGALRERGVRGDDLSLAFFEWSADEADYDPVDPGCWALANPGMGIRILPEYIAKERATLAAEDFARERLSIGDYPAAAGDWSVIRRAVWDSRADPESPRPTGRPAFAADASPGQAWGTIVAAGHRPDGKAVVEIPLGDHRPGVGWIVPRFLELRKHGPCAFVVDPRGPAAGLIPEAEAAGLEIVKPTLGEAAQAFAQFHAAVCEGGGTLVHLGQQEFAIALAGATVRDTGDGGKLWARKDTSVVISPLVGGTLAHWALGKFGRAYDLMKSVAGPS